MTDLVGHLLLFGFAAVAALIVPLSLGKLVRPKLPTAEKDSIYECGEPTIGTSYIQFDLRYYVVALVFIVFDVEVIFFFPWALIYGGAMQLADTRIADEARTELSAKMLNVSPASLDPANVIGAETAYRLGAVGFVDVLIFFGVLLVGFFYVWKRGDLDWVRALSQRTQAAPARAEITAVEQP
ncbi:MAG TPA: NADH-quinone oxidoreductase subunit A [Planctomycetaceae bacterium]|nr:NADH-quinone oxidoreductase subunit A [Planctomycetaceae bacterium]